MQDQIQKLPYHLAIIMDGNRRWAKLNHLSIFDGHKKGLERLHDICNYASDLGIFILSLYAFSIENWKRDKSEIENLMSLFEIFFKKYFKKIKQKEIRVVFTGEKRQLNPKIIKMIDINDKRNKKQQKIYS